jgi:DNA polymerase V
MEGAGIFSGDLAVVDKSLEPQTNDVVVACVDGDFTLKHFQRKGDKGFLVAANDKYPAIEVGEDNDFQIWGVVTFTVHQQRQA